MAHRQTCELRRAERFSKPPPFCIASRRAPSRDARARRAGPGPISSPNTDHARCSLASNSDHQRGAYLSRRPPVCPDRAPRVSRAAANASLRAFGRESFARDSTMKRRGTGSFRVSTYLARRLQQTPRSRWHKCKTSKRALRVSGAHQ